MGGKEQEKGGWRQLGWAQLRWLNVFHMFIKELEAFPASGQMNGWKGGWRKRSSPTHSAPTLPATSLSPSLYFSCSIAALFTSEVTHTHTHTETHTHTAPVTPASLHRQPLCFGEDFQAGYDYESQQRRGKNNKKKKLYF